MDAILRTQDRKQAQSRRRPPQHARRAFLPWEGDGDLTQLDPSSPVELIIEATDSNGELAVWLTDAWWIDAVQLWKDRAATMHLLATPRSTLNPVILHQLSMLRRVVPQWRLVAEQYLADVQETQQLEFVALSPYDEVRLIEGHRPGSPIGATRMRLDEFCTRLGEIQAKHRITRPVITALSDATEMPRTVDAAASGMSSTPGKFTSAASAARV